MSAMSELDVCRQEAGLPEGTPLAEIIAQAKARALAAARELRYSTRGTSTLRAGSAGTRGALRATTSTSRNALC